MNSWSILAHAKLRRFRNQIGGPSTLPFARPSPEHASGRTQRKTTDWDAIIGRYLFNVELARGLHTVLNWAEVGLRNHLHASIRTARPVREFEPQTRITSWLTAVPPVLLGPEQARVAEVISGQVRAARWRGGRSLTEDLLVAELSFGFWTRLLDSQYENWRLPRQQRLWPELLSQVFPNFRGAEKTRAIFYARFSEIRMVRNRVFHHERITHLADPALYDRIVEAIGWMHADIPTLLIAQDRPRFMALYEAGPQPWIDRAATWAADPDNLNDP